MENKNELFKLLGGITLISAVGTGLYYFYNYITKKKLPTWLEQEIQKASQNLQLDFSLLNTFEFKSLLINLLMEIQDIIFYENYSLFEENRQNFLGQDKSYAEAADKTLEYREKCFSEALNLLSKKIYLDINTLRHNLEEINDKDKLIEALEKVRIVYPSHELPNVDKETFKNAYIEYLNNLIFLCKNNIEHDNIVKVQPELEEIVRWLYYQNKLTLYDTIYKKYKIKEKYFPQLLKQFNYSDDNEIKSLLQELKKVNSRKELDNK